MRSTLSCGMKLLSVQPRIVSTPPMKKRRSGYVCDEPVSCRFTPARVNAAMRRPFGSGM